MARYYPIFLNLRGRRCIVIGGGRVAERKVRALLRAQADLRVVSPELTARLAQLAKAGTIQVIRRRYRKGDLMARAHRVAPLLVFAATDDPTVQRAVWKEANAIGALVNIADDRERSTFLVPAAFARGGLQVAISTSGASPALARSLRRRLEAALGREFEAQLRFLRAARAEVLESLPRQKDRARVFRRLAAGFKEIKRQKSEGKYRGSGARSRKSED